MSLLVLGCEAPNLTSAPAEESMDAALNSMVRVDSPSLAEVEQGNGVSLPPATAQPRPQLIKRATLRVELTDVEGAIATISDILTEYQGDLLELSDQQTQTLSPRQVNFTLRVPQQNLELVLEALRSLGTVKEQSITAEDVADQLVDLQARVRNLRKSEEALLEIMERSGSIAEVLEVTRELNTVREAIERIDAQLKALQGRVAYSTITLTVVSNQSPAPTPSPIGDTLSQTWQTAGFSVRMLSVGLLQLLLWLLVFSPYLAILVLGSWAGRRYWQRHRAS